MFSDRCASPVAGTSASGNRSDTEDVVKPETSRPTGSFSGMDPLNAVFPGHPGARDYRPFVGFSPPFSAQHLFSRKPCVLHQHAILPVCSDDSDEESDLDEDGVAARLPDGPEVETERDDNSPRLDPYILHLQQMFAEEDANAGVYDDIEDDDDDDVDDESDYDEDDDVDSGYESEDIDEEEADDMVSPSASEISVAMEEEQPSPRLGLPDPALLDMALVGEGRFDLQPRQMVPVNYYPNQELGYQAGDDPSLQQVEPVNNHYFYAHFKITEQKSPEDTEGCQDQVDPTRPNQPSPINNELYPGMVDPDSDVSPQCIEIHNQPYPGSLDSVKEEPSWEQADRVTFDCVTLNDQPFPECPQLLKHVGGATCELVPIKNQTSIGLELNLEQADELNCAQVRKHMDNTTVQAFTEPCDGADFQHVVIDDQNSYSEYDCISGGVPGQSDEVSYLVSSATQVDTHSPDLRGDIKQLGTGLVIAGHSGQASGQVSDDPSKSTSDQSDQGSCLSDEEQGEPLNIPENCIGNQIINGEEPAVTVMMVDKAVQTIDELDDYFDDDSLYGSAAEPGTINENQLLSHSQSSKLLNQIYGENQFDGGIGVLTETSMESQASVIGRKRKAPSPPLAERPMKSLRISIDRQLSKEHDPDVFVISSRSGAEPSSAGSESDFATVSKHFESDSDCDSDYGFAGCIKSSKYKLIGQTQGRKRRLSERSNDDDDDIDHNEECYQTLMKNVKRRRIAMKQLLRL